MALDRARAIAAAVEEQQHARRIAARRQRPFAGDAAEIDAFERDVAGHRPDRADLLDPRPPLGPAHRSRLRYQQRADRIDIAGHARTPISRHNERKPSRRVVPRPIDEIDHAVAAVELELKPRDRPGSVFLDRLQKNRACRLRPACRKPQDCLRRRVLVVNRAARKAGRDRRAEKICRHRAGLKCGHPELVGLGMFEEIKAGAESPAEQHDQAQPDDGSPYRPLALHALEMLHAVPAAVAPGPAAALRAEHERHYQLTEDRNEGKERDERVVADAPYPAEQKGAPVPAVDFRRNGSGLGKNLWVAHYPPLSGSGMSAERSARRSQQGTPRFFVAKADVKTALCASFPVATAAEQPR